MHECPPNHRGVNRTAGRESRFSPGLVFWNDAGTTFAIESVAADRVCASYRTLPLTENDIEFGNVPRAMAHLDPR